MNSFKFFNGFVLEQISDDWLHITFPMIRRVFANTIGHDLVGVEPMQVPNGMIFYMGRDYGTIDKVMTFKIFRGLHEIEVANPHRGFVGDVPDNNTDGPMGVADLSWMDQEI